MKINELYKPKEIDNLRKSIDHVKTVDSRDQSWQSILPQFLQKYNFKLSGKGKYGSVFVHETYPYALKIFMKDAAYIKWLKFCRENQDNPFVPKMKGNIVKITDIIFAVRIEKLNPYHGARINDNDLNQTMLNILENFQYKIYKAKDAMPEPTGNKWIDDIINVFEQHENLLDIHSDNFMVRNDGQIVIIDPFYNWFDRNLNKYTIDPDDV